MVAKIGTFIETKEGDKLLVDDIKNINGVDYLVLFVMEKALYLIATETVIDNKPEYNILPKDEAIKIAKEIDKLNNK